MAYSEKRLLQYLERNKTLPGGTLLYQMTTDGKIYVTGNGTIQEVSKDNVDYNDKLHLFINPGNQAYYLLGNPDTSEKNPNNATVKMGVTDAHHHFTPHAHGSQHFVKSEGFSGALLYDHDKKKAFVIKLLPNSLIYIPAWIPHAFYNRSDVPLITLIANGGIGIHNEDYAVTKEIAEQRLEALREKGDENLEVLIATLGTLEDFFEKTHPEQDMDAQERVASKLYKVAEYFGIH